MIEIIPAIIAQTYEDFEQKIKSVESFVDRVHLDIMDGIFVSNRTIGGIEEINKINTKLKFGVHLMVQNPQHYFIEWFETKADIIFVHIESDVDIASFINQANLKGKQTGIAINPETDVERLNGFAHIINAVQFMTVHPGQYGALFVESVLPKISSFHIKYPHVKIYIDGGMNPDTAKRAVAMGASGIIAGSYIFNHPEGIENGIEELKKAINHY